MSSSIEEEFQPPEWATKEEVIKAACHYINYWKIEARSRNQQWLDAMDANARLKAENDRLKAALQQWKGNHSIVIEDRDTLLLALVKLKDENERLRASSFVTAVPVEQYERVVAGGELVLREWSMGNEKGANNYLKALVIWNAAKEGKPSV